MSLVNDYSNQLSSKRMGLMLNTDVKMATKLSLWEQFKDLFRDNKKADALAQLHRVIHPKLPTSDDVSGTDALECGLNLSAPIPELQFGQLHNFNKLKHFAKKQHAAKFSVGLSPNRCVQYSIAGKTIHEQPLHEMLHDLKYEGQDFFRHFGEEVIEYTANNIDVINAQREARDWPRIKNPQNMAADELVDMSREFMKESPSVAMLTEQLEAIGADYNVMLDTLDDWHTQGTEAGLKKYNAVTFFVSYFSVKAEQENASSLKLSDELTSIACDLQKSLCVLQNSKSNELDCSLSIEKFKSSENHLKHILTSAQPSYQHPAMALQRPFCAVDNRSSKDHMEMSVITPILVT